VSLEKLVEINSYNTARIHGIPNKGVIAPSYDADIIIVDLKKTRKVTPEMLHGVSDFSLYEGLELKGWPIMTICGGTTVMEDGEIVGKPGTGMVVKNQPLQM
ncbi:MAG: amidohydrolase family protein, partial [Candidatus Bathyarchaeia archaeon]